MWIQDTLGSRPAEPCRADLAGQLTLPPPGRVDAEPVSFLRLRQNRKAPRAAATTTAVTADVWFDSTALHGNTLSITVSQSLDMCRSQI
jgi:hypothetical protein